MGTQQILMIVLSVIIVGIAVGVGITMFQTQAINSNRQAVLGDLNNFGAQAVAYYKTPTSMSGGGNDFTSADGSLEKYLGFVTDAGVVTVTITNGNGTYTLGVHALADLTITGLGTEMYTAAKRVGGELTINMSLSKSKQISVVVKDET